MSTLHFKAEIIAPKLSPINYFFNISVPTLGATNASDKDDVSEHSKRLMQLQEQIEEMKQTVPLYDSVSSHDIHHYTATYIIVAVATVGIAIWGSRKILRRRSAQAAAERTERPTLATPWPAAARRRPPSSTTGIDQQAVVEPVILYAAAVWAPAVDKLGVRKRLNAVQRGFAQKLCRAYRTTSLNSALLLAGILPLDLRVREAATLYEARRGVPQRVIGDQEVERMTSALRSPHPACHVDLEFKYLVDQEQFNANSDNNYNIFTDGSKIEGKVGAALSVWNGAAEATTLKLGLPSYCTVYQAELLAICRAARMAADDLAGSVGIYSDSSSALLTLKNPKALHPLAVEARGHLQRALLQGKRVSLHWIKAHAGLEGNERADHLAKEAALELKRAFDYDSCPVSFIKRSIRMQSIDEWNRRYRDGETAGVTKVFFPDAIAAYKITSKIKVDRFVTQALTGHGGFSEYLYRFKCKESPSCVCDPGCPESVFHVLLECPTFAYERLRFQCQTGVALKKETLSEIIKNGKVRPLFLQYCSKIVIDVNNRNRH
ncbi:uncharacterized protein LOC123659888 [Melitaea cinxia]|uniref:uncharacterized protein LOC123659888 n=1 Tax=Melitaea cinxia TaxID=113334 RepID=UPI001E271E05|nr:uncharacterized protein LOC123659888 [Melitaea cinxia]